MTEAHPTPPEDVRLILDDGTEVPVDCAYQGVSDGDHVWSIASRRDCWPRVRSVLVGVFPPKTALIPGDGRA